MVSENHVPLPKELLDHAERAAIVAGYHPRTARMTAAKLLRTPRIIARLEEMTCEAILEEERLNDENAGTD